MARGLLLLLSVMAVSLAGARPAVVDEADRCIITGNGYRVVFTRETCGLSYDLPDGTGWKPIARTPQELGSALMTDGSLLETNRRRATLAVQTRGDAIAISRATPLGVTGQVVAQLEYLCADDGVLFGYRISGEAGNGVFWSPPRIRLRAEDWDQYAFYAADGVRHSGQLGALQPCPAYAGVSAWGDQGDVVKRLNPQSPALLVQSTATSRGLGVIYLDYDGAWQGASGFLQRHTPETLFLYAGYSPAASDQIRWAWLAPFASLDPKAEAARVKELLQRGETLVAGYAPVAAALPEDWLKPLPDFPQALRRTAPVTDIRDAAVYTINEYVTSAEEMDLVRKTGSDVLIRGWFKWGQAPAVEKWRNLPGEAQALGALFGGGITCSALYDTENGLTREQLADMATRGPDGQFVDAWDTPGVRHGSLSSPAYLDYLFRWCREQIDAGADYMFMDETNAAISEKEGYDDHSLADFRRYLLQNCPQTAGWKADDARWKETWGIPLDSREICPDGTMASFDYRAFLRVKGLLDKPVGDKNALSPLWWQFRAFRDDRAWKALTDRMRAYAKEKGQPLLISGNGLVKYADLQVLGVWGSWTVKDGRVDLSESQLPHWRSLVEQGQRVAGKPVPVVLFHDWGFGEPPFPWMAVSAANRELWMRTRGAEIYAAGGFFAFPVLGPFGCNAAEDGTLGAIARQTAFYQAQRDLYLKSRYLGCEQVTSDADSISLAAWWNPERRSLLVHAINRATEGVKPAVRRDVIVRLPVTVLPQQVKVASPDAAGETAASCRLANGKLEVTFPSLEAYSVAILTYDVEPNLAALADPLYVRPGAGWGRPQRNEFQVRATGDIENATDLYSFLQGTLHTGLRNQPVFLVKAQEPGRLEVHVRAVAATGARLEYQVDGKTVKTVDLPDLDGKNDGAAQEYNQTYTFEVPAGEHRLTVDNTGGDWAVIDWYAFRGKWLD